MDGQARPPPAAALPPPPLLVCRRCSPDQLLLSMPPSADNPLVSLAVGAMTEGLRLAGVGCAAGQAVVSLALGEAIVSLAQVLVLQLPVV